MTCPIRRGYFAEMLHVDRKWLRAWAGTITMDHVDFDRRIICWSLARAAPFDTARVDSLYMVLVLDVTASSESPSDAHARTTLAITSATYQRSNTALAQCEYPMIRVRHWLAGDLRPLSCQSTSHGPVCDSRLRSGRKIASGGVPRSVMSSPTRRCPCFTSMQSDV